MGIHRENGPSLKNVLLYKGMLTRHGAMHCPEQCRSLSAHIAVSYSRFSIAQLVQVCSTQTLSLVVNK